MKFTAVLAAAVIAAGTMTHAALAQQAPQDYGKIAAEAQTGKKEPKPKVQEAEVRAAKKAKVALKSGNKARKSVKLGKASAAPELVATARDGRVARAVAVTGGRYERIVSRYATAYGISPQLAHAVIRVESNYRADARGKAGEVGLMQIKPATARALGYSGSVKALYEPDTNIRYGMKYLAKAHELSGGTTCGTILRYNAGHGAKRMNPVSAAYCSKVKQHLAAR